MENWGQIVLVLTIQLFVCILGYIAVTVSYYAIKDSDTPEWYGKAILFTFIILYLVVAISFLMGIKKP